MCVAVRGSRLPLISSFLGPGRLCRSTGELIVGVPGHLECALDGCLVWANAPAVCASACVSPLGVVPGDATKERSSLYSRPTEPPSALNKDTPAHIDTFFGGGCWCVSPFFVASQQEPQCTTKIGHFRALQVFHPHCPGHQT